MKSFAVFLCCYLGTLVVRATDAPSPFSLLSPLELLPASNRAYYSQTRAAIIPGERPRILLTTQETALSGTHGYRDLFYLESVDATTWSTPERIPSLTRRTLPSGYEVVMGDVTAKWHVQSGKVLATGKTFNFRDGKTEDRSRERVSYAVFDPKQNRWSELGVLELPAQDHAGQAFVAANSGCVQRIDLPDGDILLPIRYHKGATSNPYVTTVVRCSFDGSTLRYKSHGTELGGPKGARLYEPSLTMFKGEYFLTLRSDATGYVTRSRDGIAYEPVTEWKFEDGSPVGTYNTQQHWVTHGDRLFLTYTRRGANNDHIFRHRAPIFMAEVDPQRLCILRHTEKVLLSETGADLGNFGVANVSSTETWVVAAEMTLAPGRTTPRKTVIARIQWSTPNTAFPLN